MHPSSLRCPLAVALAVSLAVVTPGCRRAAAPGADASMATTARACPSGRAVLAVDNRTIEQVEIVTWERGSTTLFVLAPPGRTEHAVFGPERGFAARAPDGRTLGVTGRPSTSGDRVLLALRCAEK